MQNLKYIGMYVVIHMCIQGLSPLLPQEATGLTLDSTLFPQYLKQNGYSTHMVGKYVYKLNVFYLTIMIH